MTTRGLSRDRLVQIAHDHVATHGVDALTVRRLAAAAGVTPGALYKHVRDKRDLQRAMADAVLATIELADLADPERHRPTAADVLTCCERLRAALLAFRDGGRIVAGSYAPFAASAALGATLRGLLGPLVIAPFDAGDVAYALRNYTVGFVIEEQAYLALVAAGQWDALVESLDVPEAGGRPGPDPAPSDGVAILTGDRDARFRAGLVAILTGTVDGPV